VESNMNRAPSWAIVTGASSGIGSIYADRLAARGHHLVLVARRRDRLEDLAEKLRSRNACDVHVLVADLATEEGLACVEATVRDIPDLALIANVAGSGALAPAALADAKLVDGMLRVNVLALTRLSLTAARRFAAAKAGTIINIGSILAVMPVPGAGGYSGSKAYVVNFSRSLQAELAESGVTVQLVMPGPVRSEFFGDVPAPFPEAMFMTAETLVDTALAALDQGETITFPNLTDVKVWQDFEASRGDLTKAVTQSGQPAPRYGREPHSTTADLHRTSPM
jgi:short-subunit dehydrogenase